MATTPTSPPPPQDHHSPSNPSSPKPPKTLSPPKKTQPIPWTHQETISLIRAYQEKWYSLKRGQLKAGQWEEVAVTVAALCGRDDDDPSKSATQCRHKIEKLRKRYRAEKQKNPNPNSNSWQYFSLMDQMERGPLPISARPLSMIQYQNSNSSDDEEEDGDDEDEYDLEFNTDSKKNRSKSINHILRNPANVHRNTFVVDRKLSGGGGSADRVSRVLQNPMSKKRKECFESDEEDDEDDEEEDEGGQREMVKELAAEIRAFAERFVRMENKKMEMMKETERFRMEMENKRMEMILESHRKMVDTIGRAFGSQES